MTETNQTQSPRARLVCIDESLLRGVEGRIVELDDAGTTLGRGADNDVSVDADGVSRRHARLYLESGRWGIKDLGSTNGLLVNDTSTREAWLNHGDIVMLGKLPYRFVLEAVETELRESHDITGIGERTVVLNDLDLDQPLPDVFAGNEEPESGLDITGTSDHTLSMGSVAKPTTPEPTQVSQRHEGGVPPRVARSRAGGLGDNLGAAVWLIVAGVILLVTFLAALIIR